MFTSTTPVLLLHGQPGSARDWDRVIAALDDPTGAIAVNRPGWNGGSAATDIDGNVRAALDALDRQGVERAVIVGHSYGAAIACRLAVEHPERVSALVLLAPAANRASLLPLDYVLAAPVGGPAASAAVLAGSGWALWPGPLRRRIADQFGLDEDHLARTGRALRRPSAWRAFSAEQRSLVAELPELELHLDRIVAPTVIMIGSADLVVPPRSAWRLATRIPDAEVIEIEHAGHLLPQVYARQVARVIDAQRAR